VNDTEKAIETKLKQDIKAGNVVTIAGTGVSVAACGDTHGVNAVATWKGLLEHGANHCLDLGWATKAEADAWKALIATGKTRSMIGAAELITQCLKEAGQGRFAGWLENTVGQLSPKCPEVIEVLSAYPGVLATLSYDALIEKVTGREPITWLKENHTSRVLRKEKSNAVLHLHGFFEEPESVVLGFESYLDVKDHPHAKAVRQALATTYTLFFVGCGDTFHDPNFEALIDWGNKALGNVVSPHVVLCRAEQVSEFRNKLASAKWLQILPYEGGYEGLVPYLKTLHTASGGHAPVNVHRATPTNDFAGKLNTYLATLSRTTRVIKLGGIKTVEGDKPVELPLEAAYVPLRAMPRKSGLQNVEAETDGIGGRGMNAETPKSIEMNQVLLQGTHLAITGGAGSGKSTVLLHMAWALATAIVEGKAELAAKVGLRGKPDELPVPVLVSLAALAKDRRTSHVDDLRTLISQQMFLAKGRQSPEFFEQLLESQRSILLLLDGLDEVADEGEREVFSKAIENLAAVSAARGNYLRIIVTCRTVAYKGFVTLGGDFREIAVQALDLQAHITPMVRQAYTCIFPGDNLLIDQRSNHLLRGIQTLEAERRKRLGENAARLVDTPLMVRLLLIVQTDKQGELPKGRAELFEKVIEALLKVNYGVDPAINHGLAGDWKQRRELLQYVAFHMHQRETPKAQANVETNSASGVIALEKGELRKLLKDTQFELQTNDLITHASDRASVLEERDGKFQFIHLALQEFLVARYLHHLIETQNLAAGLAELEQKLTDSWWREPILLLLAYSAWEGGTKSASELLSALSASGEMPDSKCSAAELAATAALEWDGSSDDIRSQCARRIVDVLAETITDENRLKDSKPVFRARAGDALAELGDPRFDPVRYYLPASDDWGFVTIPADPHFLIGTHTNRRRYVAEKIKAQVPEDEINDQPTATQTFRIARYPVTVAQFRAFVEATKHKLANEQALSVPGNRPVADITWHEARQYCGWLKQVFAQASWLQGRELDLPSELEWEKAVRGGLNGLVFPWGDDPDPNRANYLDSGIGESTAVGCFPANGYGLYDMTGNVWEYTRTLRGELSVQPELGYPYPDEPAARAQREDVFADDNVARVMRSGAWHSPAFHARCAYRSSRILPGTLINGGFRMVLR
jgi:formylglycine-generating enzyme required for sulfatase activity/energy-coupling factor transporter ATP-binding protein EcfA2